MKKIYFISDAHLGSLMVENAREQEKRLVTWLDGIKNEAAALYLLGDMFDFWYEYRLVVPRGYTRFLGKLAELADAGIELHFFIGNHDIWTFDYLEKEIGMTIHRKPYITEIYGKRFFLAHGDGLGDPSLRFKLIRGLFHNRLAQILFSALHPRIGVGIGLLWSKQSRKKKESGFSAKYLGEDKEHLVQFAKAYTGEHIDFFVFGHRHIILNLELRNKSRVAIIGDWMELFSYAVFDGKTFLVEQV
ncbi:MAG: UDP-2,3-diacylglucosamine diphosphatase [Prevotellaceae bacterium]|jgi:UDP-2,3-diacylglucosamine hydrolase|nr:UDP-2,3-diacylglucosamine diphosphatase [Prevotellaceae bacterium]